jgi:hypothetical protein
MKNTETKDHLEILREKKCETERKITRGRKRKGEKRERETNEN